MRRLAVIALALAAAVQLAACGNACQDLGDRLCSCVPAGTASDTCKQEVKNRLSDTGVSASAGTCSNLLATCEAPSGAQLCEWVNTSCGKYSCGLAYGTKAENCPAGP
jgi:hypothetical protein